jgi:transposase
LPSQCVSRTVPPAIGGTCAGAVEISDLLPHLRGVVVERVECTADGLVIWARWQAVRAACPRCGTWSSRVHSGYVRRLHDSPAGGRPVLIRLWMRRFLCTNPACRAVTFAGQADGLTARYQRRSVPLAWLLSQLALELAGRAGARLARALGITIHHSTLLRLVMTLPDPPISAAPEVVGVDDFALRRGHVYATILVDATTGQAVDVLPGRESGPLADWLAAHPGAQVICRDRAGAYAEGAREGAPAAVQVADRWHLWHNLAEHTVKAVARHRSCLKQITAARPPETAAGPEPDAATAAPESRLETRMRDQHATVQALAARGLGIRAIARELGADRKTARRFVQALTAEDAVARAISRPTVLDRYQPHLHRRWAEGCHDAAVLRAEITALGYRGSLRTVYRYLQPLRAGTTVPPGALPPLKVGEVTSWLLRRAEDLDPRDQEVLTEIRAHCAQLDHLAGHVTSFAKMMTRRTGERDLPAWLEQVEADDQPELHTFATGIRQDLAAVTAGLSLPYSSGSTEGNVNRLKALKRQMYGRASLDLLRKRVIHHPG